MGLKMCPGFAGLSGAPGLDGLNGLAGPKGVPGTPGTDFIVHAEMGYCSFLFSSESL